MRRFLVLIVLGLVVGMLLAPATALADFGIDPGKVYIENLYPGAEADIPITIYNQNDYETAFRVIAREPDYTATDYESFPYLDWITITPDQVTIGAKGQSDVLVVIIMPEDAEYSGKKAEVWISFMEQETEGMIKIELCSRLFISTRTETESEPEAPVTTGEGGVGITADAEAEPVSPEVEPVPSRWTILGPVLGVVVGVAVFFLMKRKRRRHV
ncbi:hypothetical protein ES703_43077 [subsurface metagenome]